MRLHRLSAPMHFPVLVALTTGFASPTYGCCVNFAEFAAQCRAQGGIPSTGAVCTPDLGGASGGPGGMSSNQQMMMDVAGALGDAFREMLRQQSAKAAIARQQAMERAAIEMARFQAQEHERQRQMEARHRLLLASLKGGINSPEMALKRGLESGTLTLKIGDDYFGATQKTAILEMDEAKKGAELPTTVEPPTPEGTLVSLEQMDRIKTDYERAADELAKAKLRRQRLDSEKNLAVQIREEASKKHAEQQAQAATISPNQTTAKQEEENKLAEAERLLQQAINLDEKATQDLNEAKQDVERTERDLARANQERERAEKTLAQASSTPSK